MLPRTSFARAIQNNQKNLDSLLVVRLSLFSDSVGLRVFPVLTQLKHNARSDVYSGARY